MHFKKIARYIELENFWSRDFLSFNSFLKQITFLSSFDELKIIYYRSLPIQKCDQK